MNFELDLEMDFETYKKHPETPIFHRIRFDRTSIYLTKSTFRDLSLSKNQHGNYRVLSWDDWRAKAFLGFELGDVSPALGFTDLIGHFSPTEDDLTDIQYDTLFGKQYFKSAKRILTKQFHDKDAAGSTTINSYEFMRMNEIIPTGAQGKAIYGEGNYIIDGPAGSGKSTTVIQKIKLLVKNEKIDFRNICIIVKNEMVVSEFTKLLNSIGIKDIKIMMANDFINKNFDIKSNECDIKKIREQSTLVFSAFSKLSNESLRLSKGHSRVNDYDSEIISTLAVNDYLAGKIKSYKIVRNDLNDLVLLNRKAVIKLQGEIASKTEKLYESLVDRLTNKKSKSFFNFGGLGTGKKRTLSLGDEASIRDEVNKNRAKLDLEVSKLTRRNKESESKYFDGMRLKVKSIENELLSISFSESAFGIDGKIFNYYLNKLFGNSAPFHTLILDEAQDVSLKNIELSWLISDNIILTGDEMQKELLDGIGYWKNLDHMTSVFLIEDRLNIFTLKHNFRQTYELGSCSFNYRQLIMNKSTIDISDEYFENQKGFKKPQIKYIENKNDFLGLVNDKIGIIYKTFSDLIPVVIFYENESSLEKLSKILDYAGIEYSIGVDDKKPIMFVSLDSIAGRSFPVVLAPLTNNTSYNTIYIMLSRAKYDLSLFTWLDKTLDPHIENLLSKEIIVEYGD